MMEREGGEGEEGGNRGEMEGEEKREMTEGEGGGRGKEEMEGKEREEKAHGRRR